MTRRTKSTIASTTPTSMATVRSTMTVRKKVMRRTATSDLSPRSRYLNVLHSLMLYATCTRIAARHESGIYTAYGIRNRYMSRSTAAWMRPVTGLFPPLLMLAIVLARAPVAGIPPKRGVTMFAIPCPMSSVFALCCFPVAPSATMAARSDSMAQRMAMVNAGETSPLTVS